MPVSSNTRSTGAGPSSIERSTPCSCARASSRTARRRPDDVHEAQVGEVEDDRAVAVVQHAVHAALERGDGRAVELAMDLDVRRLADAPECGAEAFDPCTVACRV